MRAMLWAMVVGGLASSLALAAEAAKDFGKCPVSGNPAKEAVSAEIRGKQVHFCCEGCPSAVEKDPKAFAAKIHHQWLVTGQIVQTGCPFSGGKVNPKTVVEFDGAKFGFCCEKCQAKYDAADDKQGLVFAKIDKGFTLQDKCPVSKKPIDVTKSADYKGKKVYFCCGGCPKAFEKDPEKFAANLPKEDAAN